MLRTALMTVVAAGTLVGVATPASAAPGDPTISITGLDNGNLQPGSQATLTFTIKASGLAAGNSYNIAVTSSLAPDVTLKHGGSNCGGSCTYLVTIAPGDSKDDSVTLVAAQNPTGVPAGQQKGGSIRIDVTDPDTSKTVTKSQAITLQGPAQQAPTSVNQISGTVKDVSTGQPIPGATVGLQDSAGHNFSTTTNNSGQYTFKSTQSNPIAPGTLAVEAVKDGYKAASNHANVQAGQSFAFQALMLESTATPSATGPAAVDPSLAAPSDSQAAVQPITTPAAKTGGSGVSTILIALGGLLVLLGIAAIVFILVRRRRDDGEDPDELDEDAPRRGPSPVPASRGNYRGAPDATAVVRSGGYGEPTMAGRSPMSDAPTMMHSRPPVDECPGPCGAPPRTGYES